MQASTEELDPFSTLEDVSILPVRASKESCGTLQKPGALVAAQNLADNNNQAHRQKRTNATTEGRLIASAGERCAIFVYSHFLLNSNPTVPSTVTSLQLAARRAAQLAQPTAAAQIRLGAVSARKHTRSPVLQGRSLTKQCCRCSNF